jgi:phosphopantothenoylcysteine decarboxylase/phosphopantothenate--cysteine ligase
MRGADVTLVAGHSEMHDPSAVTTRRVGDAREMQEVVDELAPSMDAVVMAAAVADHRPAKAASTKMKKDAATVASSLDLVENPDILAGLAADRRPGQVVVGFAAETGDASGTVLDLGRRKLAAKGCDLLVVNEVGGATGFGSLDNEAVVLAADGSSVGVPLGSKERLAAVVWDEVRSRLPGTVRGT